MMRIMVTTLPPLSAGVRSPFAATRSPQGDIVVFYLGPEPRMTSEQAVAFADQLLTLVDEGAGSHPGAKLGN
jgi:hypothetical protein